MAVGTHLDESLFLFGLRKDVLGGECEGEDCKGQGAHSFILSLIVVWIE